MHTRDVTLSISTSGVHYFSNGTTLPCLTCVYLGVSLKKVWGTIVLFPVIHCCDTYTPPPTHPYSQLNI